MRSARGSLNWSPGCFPPKPRLEIKAALALQFRGFCGCLPATVLQISIPLMTQSRRASAPIVGSGFPFLPGAGKVSECLIHVSRWPWEGRVRRPGVPIFRPVRPAGLQPRKSWGGLPPALAPTRAELETPRALAAPRAQLLTPGSGRVLAAPNPARTQQLGSGLAGPDPSLETLGKGWGPPPPRAKHPIWRLKRRPTEVVAPDRGRAAWGWQGRDPTASTPGPTPAMGSWSAPSGFPEGFSHRAAAQGSCLRLGSSEHPALESSAGLPGGREGQLHRGC